MDTKVRSAVTCAQCDLRIPEARGLFVHRAVPAVPLVRSNRCRRMLLCDFRAIERSAGQPGKGARGRSGRTGAHWGARGADGAPSGSAAAKRAAKHGLARMLHDQRWASG